MGEQHPEARLPTPLVALLLCGFSVLQAMAAAASKEGGDALCLAREVWGAPDADRRRALYFTTKTLAAAAVPGVAYQVLNNLNFVTLYYVDAPTFQILGNLKIVAPDCAGDGAAFLRLGDRAYGYASAVACVGLSATMGVFTEAFMKGTRSSIHFQNMQLYAFGIAANLAAPLPRRGRRGPSPLFAGFNVWGSVATVANGCCGLAVSFMLRYADSIAKTYASALTIPATAAASYARFGTPVGAASALGSGVMLASLAFFYGGADLFAPPDAGKLPGAADR
ncbi:pyrimidine nucleotide-sugar transmembrane transporter [Aureococcus anophagefferens]|nr:pyrimidine nucleotide-sugar transmembrane transporter [Aureococcus anophagefferens]